MAAKQAKPKKESKKSASTAKPKASGTKYEVSTDAKGNITKIVAKKK